MRFIPILIIISLLLFTHFASADTLILKNGKTVEGKIIEKTDEYIKIEFESIPLTFFLDEIEAVEQEIPAIITKTEEQKEKLKKKLLRDGIVDVIYDIKAVTPDEKTSKIKAKLLEYEESGEPLPNISVQFTAPEDNPAFQVKDPSEETETERKRRESAQRFYDER